MCLLIDGVAGLASVRGWVLSAASMGRSRLRLVDERRRGRNCLKTRSRSHFLRRRCKVNLSLGVHDPRVTGPPTLTLKAWINPKRLNHTFGVPCYCIITWGRRPPQAQGE